MFEQTSAFLKKPIEDEVIERMDAANRDFLARHEMILAEMSGGDLSKIERIDSRDLLRGHLKSLNLSVNNQLFFSFSFEDNFEIWSLNMKFLATGNQLIKRLSYSIEDLLTQDWNELFGRDYRGQEQIAVAVSKLQAGQGLVTDVAPHHAVWERGAGGCGAMVQVKAVTVANDILTGLPAAFVAVTNIKDQATN